MYAGILSTGSHDFKQGVLWLQCQVVEWIVRKKATDASMEILHDVLNIKDASRASYWCTPQDNDYDLADAHGENPGNDITHGVRSS
jgi:hypothetical protein